MDTRIAIIKALLNDNDNIRLVLPESNTPAVKIHVDTLSTIFKC